MLTGHRHRRENGAAAALPGFFAVQHDQVIAGSHGAISPSMDGFNGAALN
jgi:hypothetical protein